MSSAIIRLILLTYIFPVAALAANPFTFSTFCPGWYCQVGKRFTSL